MNNKEDKNIPVIDRTKTYKVFISYCWSTQEHENWVYNLAERLMSDGIEVKYDKWDLKEGQDKYAFMESMVNDETINKVLVICDKGYKEKADKRCGGVGTETQIITAELYDKVEQTKFIPIIAEQGEQFDSYMPTFIKSRIGIDLSRNETFEDEYEKLLRTITERPKHRKPKIGTLPSYLFEDEESNFKTKNIVASFKNNLYKNPQQALYFVEDFFQEFMNSLETFTIKKEDLADPNDEIIYNRIHDTQKLRDDYIILLNSWSQNQTLFDIDKIISFFENLYNYVYQISGGNAYDIKIEHYGFLIMELFIYTIAILLDNQQYEAVYVLLNTKYFFNKNFDYDNEPKTFKVFHFHSQILENRNRRLQLNRVSITADLLVNRSTVNGISYKNKIIDTDMIIYYISHLFNNSIYDTWFPYTYIYAGGNYKIDILKRLVSRRHFEKIKILFGVKTITELKELFGNFNDESNQQVRYLTTFQHLMSLNYHIKYEEIGSSI